MDDILNDFFHYLKIERGLSDNTLSSYRRDLTHYQQFLQTKLSLNKWEIITRNHIMQYLYHLKDGGKSVATIARNISSIRLFHQFLIREYQVTHDASLHIETPKIKRKLPNVLSSSDVERLLSISGEDPLSLRNKAMLETLYATGLRVSELISLRLSDLHLTMGFVRCYGKGSKERIVPLGNLAKEAVESYLLSSRDLLVKKKNYSLISMVIH